MENKVEWIKPDIKNIVKQMAPYKHELLYVAIHNEEEPEMLKFVDTDYWDGEKFDEYDISVIKYFAPFQLPEYPKELD
jgi:hypothetical protein